jgi:hypothetical protein
MDASASTCAFLLRATAGLVAAGCATALVCTQAQLFAGVTGSSSYPTVNLEAFEAAGHAVRLGYRPQDWRRCYENVRVFVSVFLLPRRRVLAVACVLALHLTSSCCVSSV